MTRPGPFAAVRLLLFAAVLGFHPSAVPAQPGSPATAAPVAGPQTAQPPAPPAAERRPVVDTFHGVRVSEDYRWLEDWNDPRVRAWSEAQNRFAREHLDRLPDLPAIRARVREVYEARVVVVWGLRHVAGRFFAIKREPPRQQPFLVELESLDSDRARVVVDPNALDAGGGLAIDWFRASPDGRRLAVSMSKGGSEAGDLHLFDADTGQELEPPIRRVYGGTAGGDVAWDGDGHGFFYTRYPREGERPGEDLAFYLQVYHHRLGTPESADRHEFGQDLPRIAEIGLETDGPSGRLLVTVEYGDSGRFAHYLRSPEGVWTPLTAFDDQIVQAVFGARDDLYLISRKDAPRGRILEVSASHPDLAAAKVVVPEGDDTIVSDFWGPDPLRVVGDRLYLTYQTGGPSEVRAFTLDGEPAGVPTQLPVASVADLAEGPAETLLFVNASYVVPGAWYQYDPKSGATRRTALVVPAVVDTSNVEVRRELAVSRDGTRVPLNILLRKGTVLDGNNPALVNGYGGYGISLDPSYEPSLGILLEQGVVCVIANLRGGGEYGEAWHLAGTLTQKQNVFDDFAAVLRHLQAAGYTSPQRTAIVGASNGGLLMGATLVQHPELVRAVVAKVGVYDMLRVELTPNGAFNIPEYGTVTDPEQFAALRAYSPYHNVRDGVAYPAVLFTTGANDPRVDPMNSRKMVARLQAATSSKAPILLRTTDVAGHGFGTPLSERVEETAHEFAFVLAQLGVAYHAR